MIKTMPHPINFANSDPTDTSDTDEVLSDPVNGVNLWRRTMESQARFFSECADSALLQLARNRLLMAEQLKHVSAHTERMVSLLTHAACRSVAIAARVRRERGDRRVLPLPLPSDRRFEVEHDRRTLMIGNGLLR